MDIRSLMKKYAKLIAGTGINLQEGQPLLIRSEPVHREFVNLLAEAAYGRGCPLVLEDYSDPLLKRLRIDRAQQEDYLDFLPSHLEHMYECYLDDGWCTISLRGPEFPDAMEGVDPHRAGRAGRALSESMRGFLKGISSNRISWNVCLHPTRAWAAKVLGSEDDWERRIWEILLPVLRLDADDPAAAWIEHDAVLKRRTAHMNRSRYDGIRFSGPGTELFVGLAPDRVFAGGRCVNRNGVEFFPNIPTEEIFSTPDRRRTEGHVTVTRPVEVLGAQVEGAWFRFSDGIVTDFGADRNLEMLRQFLGFDEGAAALGEVALVDDYSPVSRSGRTFYSILFDENASSHIALGNGYADCIEEGTGMSSEELKSTGCNSSLVHTDFMIGSSEMSVFGVRCDGSEEAIMKDGVFVI